MAYVPFDLVVVYEIREDALDLVEVDVLLAEPPIGDFECVEVEACGVGESVETLAEIAVQDDLHLR
jgi:hypothetical protein